MKKYTYFVALALITSSCDDIILGEKIISRQGIKLKVFYENAAAIRVSDGILLNFQKSYTNGDTANCEVYAKRENIFTKIDLNGNKLWERVSTNSTYSLNPFLEDKSGFLWQYNGGNNLIKFDKFLNVVSDISLDFSQFIKTGNSHVNSVVMSKSGKIIGLGATFLSKDNYKPFVCEISDRGIEKLQEIGNSYADATRATFSELSNGNWFVVQYTPDYTKMTTALSLIYYDKNYQLIKSGQGTLKTTSFYTNNLVFRDDKIFITIREDNDTKVISYDADFKRNEVKFIDSFSTLNLIPSATALYAYDYAKNIYQINEQTLEIKKYVGLDIPFSSAASTVENAGTTTFVGIVRTNQAQNGIVFNKIGLNSQSTKQLYESEYPRKCNEYLPK